MLGGELTLESEPGKGSTFRVRLFLSRSQRTKPAERERTLRGYAGPARHILIVDDNRDHRQLLADALRPLGFPISMAESAEAALHIARATPPDLALIDVAMPGMNGVELIEKLRGELGLTAPLILVSAHAGDEMRRRGRDVGHNDFLAKPVNIPVLINRIGDLLELDWRYDDHPTEAEPPLWAPLTCLDALEQKLAVGHLRGLQEVLAALDATDARTIRFRRQAAALIEAVDLEGLSALVQDTRHEQ
jgi:DNA-binding response OmpR family regulator